MGEFLYQTLTAVDWAEGIQILFLVFIVWVMRKAKIANGGLEERLKRHIDERLTQVTWKMEKREQRQPKTPGGQSLADFQSGGVPGFPPIDGL